MILRQNRTAVWALFTALFLLPANFTLSSETAPIEDEADADEGETVMVYKITRPTARNPFPVEIIDRMRKELMVLMGVEPEAIEEPEKPQKTGH